ncbi:MAG: glycerol-3-phosphate dehydrogenase/oxidase, partial [Oleiphilaceae bacterium]|nr:glycerol-3-phosphate dehydrogenase/oxidase [Oleiphilaceae bacterium]
MVAHSATQAWQGGQRELALQQVAQQTCWDVVVIGGGITGAGIFREAARRGYKVLLLEQRDFAWGTSSRSSKMVHGGLRYLGSGQLGLARDSVRERQRLLAELPGLVDPLPFMMGHYRGKFPGPWLFGKLLAVYDYLAGKRYRRTLRHDLSTFWAPGINTQQLEAISGFGDAVTDDARLVMRVLEAGVSDGGLALNYVRAGALLEKNGRVSGVRVQDQMRGTELEIHAGLVVNATGVWTDQLRQQLGHEQVIRPLRGSHLVLPFWRLPVGGSFSFFHPLDKRPVFVFPWEGTTVIGTTDLDHDQDLDREAAITQGEVAYLLDAANAQFPQSGVTPEDVIATWSGVRPVVSKNQQGVSATDKHDPSDEKREHAIWDDRGMISVAGGKLTTYRLIAEEVLAKGGFNLSATRASLSA